MTSIERNGITDLAHSLHGVADDTPTPTGFSIERTSRRPGANQGTDRHVHQRQRHKERVQQHWPTTEM